MAPRRIYRSTFGSVLLAAAAMVVILGAVLMFTANAPELGGLVATAGVVAALLVNLRYAGRDPR